MQGHPTIEPAAAKKTKANRLPARAENYKADNEASVTKLARFPASPSKNEHLQTCIERLQKSSRADHPEQTEVEVAMRRPCEMASMTQLRNIIKPVEKLLVEHIPGC